MNPLVVKELRGTLGTRRFFWAHFGTLLLLGAIFLCVCFMNQHTTRETPEATGRLLFLLCVGAMVAAEVLLLPAFSCTALASERERRTMDLLVTTRMTPLQIVWGKFGAAMVYAMLFLVSALPLVLLSFLFGGVSPLEIAAAFCGLTVLAGTITAVCVGLSAPFRGTRWPTALAYTAVLGVLAPLVWGWFALWEMVFRSPGALPAGWAGFWMWEVSAALAASLTALSLILAVRSLQPPAANRAAALRIFYPAFAAVVAAVAWHAVAMDGSYMWASREQQGGCVAAIAITVLFAVPWVLLFACEAPRGSRRTEAQAARWSRIPFARWLAPGSVRGAPYALAASALLLATAPVLSHIICVAPVVTRRPPV